MLPAMLERAQPCDGRVQDPPLDSDPLLLSKEMFAHQISNFDRKTVNRH